MKKLFFLLIIGCFTLLTTSAFASAVNMNIEQSGPTISSGHYVTGTSTSANIYHYSASLASSMNISLRANDKPALYAKLSEPDKQYIGPSSIVSEPIKVSTTAYGCKTFPPFEVGWKMD